MNEANKKEWFDDEVFWREIYPILFPKVRFHDAPEEIEKILDLAGFGGKTVLDSCCGPGRHAVALAKRGLQVTGVDRTALFLERAETYAKENDVQVEWVLEDIRNFSRPGAYDLIVNLMTSFGFFEDEQENINLLHRMYENLRDDGILIIDMMGKETIARGYKPTSTSKMTPDTLFVEHYQVVNDWMRLENNWILIKDGKAETYSFSHSIYSGREIKELLLSTGFYDVVLFGSIDGAEYDPNSDRLLVIAYK